MNYLEKIIVIEPPLVVDLYFSGGNFWCIVKIFLTITPYELSITLKSI